ncbi:hypothetical protein HD554DRAFT_2012101 [Boletus coccyginus]|nr:hypothetical protein HD554DRAFT_2012101 [Boletus coccyginus]
MRCGFFHRVTSELLCPAEYNWTDPYSVTAHHWPKFLFKDRKFNREHPSEDIFQGDLLLKAFKHIFTSPSSCQKLMDVASGHGRTHLHVTALLGMKVVQLQAIAYIATQLHFALSSVRTWCNNDANFENDLFYYNIVHWFKCPKDEEAKARVQWTLLWWNQ